MQRVVILICVILFFTPIFQVNATQPLYEHSRRTWIFEELVCDTAMDHVHLIINNSFVNLGFGFDELIIQGFFGSLVSAFSPAGNEIAVIELMYLDDHNSTHLEAFVLGGGAFITNDRVRSTINPLRSNEFFFSPNYTDFVSLTENVNRHDIIIRVKTESQIVHSFGTILTVTYLRTEIEIEQDFVDNVANMDDIMDIPLSIILFPLLLLTSGDLFLSLIGAFLLVLLVIASIELFVKIFRK